MSALWIAAIVALFALHTLHLEADFPNYSPWMDYAKYTDEGWYGNAAIESFVRGSWYVPGDLNTAVAVPVWPMLEWVLFHFTGVSLVAARSLAVALFAANLMLSYLLVRRSLSTDSTGTHRADTNESAPHWAGLLAVTLMAASSFLYCFSRLAILEPLLTSLTLLSWLLVLHVLARSSPRRMALLIAVGVLFCLSILTKTTAVFLLPSMLYLLWYPLRNRLRQFLGSAAVVLFSAGVPWSVYYLLFVRPRFLADYKYFFAINVYVKPTTIPGWLMTFWYALHGTLWIDRWLVPLCVLLVLASSVWLRSLWRNSLFVAALLAVAGYIFFVGYHNNMQPRYYAVAAVPVFLMIALGSTELTRRHRVAGAIAIAAVMIAVGWNVRQTLAFARHPQYTFVNAARNLTRYIDQHPNGNRLLLSISGNDITLITGLPTICDDFGTVDLPTRIYTFRPGWYAAWNDLDPGTLEDLQTQYTLEQEAAYPAFDDPDRNLLVLYKLHPLPPSQQRLLSEIESGIPAHPPGH